MHTPTFKTTDFRAGLLAYVGKQLVFEDAGKHIQPGYHVTEIKASTFRSLDCGANPQHWHETIVQLWDVADHAERGYMPVDTFIHIWDKVNRDVGLDGDAEVKFEWGGTGTPAIQYTLASIHEAGPVVILSLEPVRATCKPRDQWWLDGDQQDARVASTACYSPSQTAAGVAVAAACCSPSQTAAVVAVADIGTDRGATTPAAGTIPVGSGVACCSGSGA